MKSKILIFLLVAVQLFCAGCAGTMKREEIPTTVTVEKRRNTNHGYGLACLWRSDGFAAQ